MDHFLEVYKRQGMALGQYIAGMGFSNVGLGIAHSMAHTLGAVYDTPHGVACAMMLPIVMEYNQECTGEKYREIARAMGVKGCLLYTSTTRNSLHSARQFHVKESEREALSRLRLQHLKVRRLRQTSK